SPDRTEPSPFWRDRRRQQQVRSRAGYLGELGVGFRPLPQTPPDSRTEVLDALNQRLPGEMQDGQSFRYGVINLGGRDRQNILTTLRDCLQHLTLRLEPV
ncbi:MAG: hypothetical protein KAY22_05720, partial [Rhizorhabdus sp.]|nr:hypothetical protein [Rhizorhabdus sp.]